MFNLANLEDNGMSYLIADKEKIIEVCQRCIEDIEEQRKAEDTENEEYYLKSLNNGIFHKIAKKLWGQKDYTKEKTIKWLKDSSGVNWNINYPCHWYWGNYNTAKTLLKMAQQTKDDIILISSEDFNLIKLYF